MCRDTEVGRTVGRDGMKNDDGRREGVRRGYEMGNMGCGGGGLWEVWKGRRKKKSFLSWKNNNKKEWTKKKDLR